LLKSDTLLHGDYCLPNIILSDWQFSGFIDLDSAGLGDRHIDLFWGIWTLNFNLKTDVWGDRFLDAYGRDRIDNEILSSIGAFEVFA
jgi:kanamycin kinase